jgi:hypothetical protein
MLNLKRPSFLELLTDDQEVLPSSMKHLSLRDGLWQSRRQSDARKVEETSKKNKSSLMFQVMCARVHAVSFIQNETNESKYIN